MRLVRKSFLLSLCLVFPFSLQAEDALVALKKHEIFFSLQQERALAADGPIIDLSIDTSQNIWLLGQRSIWQYTVLTKTLSEVPIILSHEEERLVAFVPYNVGLVVASTKNIHRISIGEKGSLKLEQISSLAGIVAINLNEELLTIITKNQIHRLDTKSWLLSSLFSLPGTEYTKVACQDKPLRCYLLSKHNLWYTDLTSKLPKARLIHESKFEFLAIYPYKSDLLAMTNYTVLQWNKLAEIVATIPVTGRQKLWLAAIDENWHSYLFDNYLLVAIDLNRNTKYQIQLSPAEKATCLVQKDTSIALLAGGKPRLFQLILP